MRPRRETSPNSELRIHTVEVVFWERNDTACGNYDMAQTKYSIEIKGDYQETHEHPIWNSCVGWTHGFWIMSGHYNEVLVHIARELPWSRQHINTARSLCPSLSLPQHEIFARTVRCYTRFWSVGHHRECHCVCPWSNFPSKYAWCDNYRRNYPRPRIPRPIALHWDSTPKNIMTG